MIRTEALKRGGRTGASLGALAVKDKNPPKSYPRFRPQGSGTERQAFRIAGSLSLTFGLVAVAAGWYFVRNWNLYGDPMGWSFLLEINARREGPLSLDTLAWR